MPLDGAVPSVGPLGTTLGEAYFANSLIPKHHPTLDDQPCGTWKFQRTFDKNFVRIIYIYIYILWKGAQTLMFTYTISTLQPPSYINK
jgi:hypothetical protein